MFSLIEIKKKIRVIKPIKGVSAPGGAESMIKDLYWPIPALNMFSKAIISNISGINSLIFKTTTSKMQAKTSCEYPHWANIETMLFAASGE